MLFGPIFGSFWCPVVTLVTFSSNLSNKKIQNLKQSIKKKKLKEMSKTVKNSENLEKSQECSKIHFKKNQNKK